MSYPNVIYGDFGDEKVAQSTKIGNLPLGQLMILPDGRKFRHAKAAAAALSAGIVVSTTAGVAAHGNVAASGLVASATTTHNVAGATDVYIVAGSVAFTKDMWADGYMNVQDDTGEGHVYFVKSNDSGAASTQIKVSLYPNDKIKTAFNPNTTTVSLRKSLFTDQIIGATGTLIAPVTGTTPTAVSASFYFWVQRGGPASLRTGATTVVNGDRVVAATATAGSVTVHTTADTSTVVAAFNKNTYVGTALETVTATEQALVDVNLE